jgi:hypothetical protein
MAFTLDSGAAASDLEALSEMALFIAFLFMFALGFGAGYGAREWKSQIRRRRYSGGF